MSRGFFFFLGEREEGPAWRTGGGGFPWIIGHFI